jgi:transposase
MDTKLSLVYNWAGGAIMKEKRRQYDRSFKLSAVRLLVGSDRPLVQVARELGISGSMLRRWLEQVRERGAKSFSDAGRLERSEILRLRREIRDLKRENEILKKTLGFEVKPKGRGIKP